MSMNYDNWERLVAAVIKREQIWQLCHQDSSATVSSVYSSSRLDFSFRGSLLIVDTFKFIRSLGSGSHYWSTDLVELEQDVQVSNQQYFGKGTKVVVKSLYNSKTMEHELEQYMDFFGSCRHENLATPWAYHFSEEKKLILYNYHSQGSVCDMLRGREGEGEGEGEGERERRITAINWESRIRIAIGAARGIAYIQQQWEGAHGNIKSSNVFLNNQQYGCVSDFCLAGVLKKGVPASQKSDMYSFGVVLLELFTRPSSMREVEDIVRHILSFDRDDWDLRRFQKGKLIVDELDMLEEKTILYVDREVLDSVKEEEFRRMQDVAKRCLAPTPPSMAEVVSELEEMEAMIPSPQPSNQHPHRCLNDTKRGWNRFLPFVPKFNHGLYR